MAQKAWYYKNETGLAYDLNMYHGDKSGHVLIYSNQAIIAIDFNVRSTKVYSFYLGDELFELLIDIFPSRASYSLKNVDTTKIIALDGQNVYPKEDLIKAVVMVALVTLLVFCVYYLVVR